MKIESIDIYHVHMPLNKPWRTAYGSDDSIESIFSKDVRPRGPRLGRKFPAGDAVLQP